MKTTGLLILLYLFTINICAQTPGDTYKERRERMVSSQIETRGLEHTSTLKAMRSVPRHLFVPEKLRDYAYDNRPLPIGHGQTISQPYIVAFMTSIVQPKADYKVLEIGTGSGYQAAILSEIVDSVYTIEIVEPLYDQAFERLADLGYDNVKVKYGDGYYGWEEHGPYDAIVVTAAAEYIPPPLLDQLKTGGKMIIPVGSPFMAQSLILISKKKDKITTSKLMPVRFVPFTRNE